ncbi:MAG: thioredoxin-related protein [Saprospiraceae bacterium]|jgi:thioredoxin-related protein
MKYLIVAIFATSIILSPSCNLSDNGFGVAPFETTEAGLNWFSIEDLEQMKNIGSRKILVDVYTGWCGWCKKMDQNTFTDPAVVAFLNKNYVLVKLNAEQKEAIQFKGETYESVKIGRRKTNKLAVKFLDGRLDYPTIVYLDGGSLKKIKLSSGYKDAQQLLKELHALTPITS